MMAALKSLSYNFKCHLNIRVYCFLKIPFEIFLAFGIMSDILLKLGNLKLYVMRLWIIFK